MPQEAFGKNIALALSSGVEQVSIAFTGRHNLTDFMYRLGWDINIKDDDMTTLETYFGIVKAVKNIANAINDLSKNKGDELTILKKLLPDLKVVIKTIKKFGEADSSHLPAPFNGGENFWKTFPEDLANWVVINIFEEELPLLYGTFYAVGIFDKQYIIPEDKENTLKVAYQKHIVNWGGLGDLFTDPLGLIKQTYQWGQVDKAFKYDRFIDVLEDFFDHVGFPVRTNKPIPTLLDNFYVFNNVHYDDIRELNLPFFLQIAESFNAYSEIGLKIMPIPEKNNPKGAPVGFFITPLVHGSITASPTADDNPYKLILKAGFDSSGIFRMEARPKGIEWKTEPGLTNLDTAIGLKAKPEDPILLIGSANSHRLELDGFFLSVGVKGRVDDLELAVRLGTEEENGNSKLRLVIQAKEGDGFISTILGEKPIEVAFGGRMEWSSKRGISFNGNVAFDIKLELHKTLGPLRIDAIYLKNKKNNDGGFDVPMGIGFALKIGPLTAVVEEIGAKLIVKKVQNGEAGLLGDLDIDWAFNPPKKIGLSIDAAVIKGGGFLEFDFDNHRYAGILSLQLKAIELTAVGLIATRLPNNKKGFSMLISISTLFKPAIQLSFGFTLNGVGGLLGINRTMKVDELRNRLASGAMESIMFPTNVIENASKIISDLRAIFPPKDKHFVAAPFLRLGWGAPSLIEVDLGVLVELPFKGRIILLGSVGVYLPAKEKPLVKINIDVLGDFNFAEEYIRIDGRLRNGSHIVKVGLSGGFAFVLSWDKKPQFLLSIGGYHPRYKKPKRFPEVPRLAALLQKGKNVKLTCEFYQAITSNSFQIGFRADLFVKYKSAKIHGYFGFNALLQFDPFYFETDVSMGVSVKYKKKKLAGIDLYFLLSGPKPWTVKGHAKIKIAFIKLKIKFNFSWGKKQKVLPKTVEIDFLLGRLKEALELPQNWSARLPARFNTAETLRSIEEEETNVVLLHPMGYLEVRQTAIPLNRQIDKYGTAHVKGKPTYQVTSVKFGNPTTASEQPKKALKEFFSRGHFEDLTDAQKISAADFEEYNAGYTFGSTTDFDFCGNVYDATDSQYEKIRFDVNGDLVPEPSARSNRRSRNASNNDSRDWASNRFTESRSSRMRRFREQPEEAFRITEEQALFEEQEVSSFLPSTRVAEFENQDAYYIISAIDFEEVGRFDTQADARAYLKEELDNQTELFQVISAWDLELLAV